MSLDEYIAHVRSTKHFFVWKVDRNAIPTVDAKIPS